MKTNGAEIRWSSEDESIATVNSSGSVKGISPGTTTVRCDITLRNGTELEAETTVNVIQRVEKLSFDLDGVITVGAGAEKQVTCVYEPQNATNPSLQWTSANPQIVEVDADGNLRGIKAGRTRITVQAQDGYGATVSREVVVSSVYADINELTLETPEEVTVRVFFKGQDAAETQAQTGAAGTEVNPDQQWFEKNYLVTQQGTGVTYTCEVDGRTASFRIRPQAASEEVTLSIVDRMNSQYRADILIHVEESAVTDAQKLPVVSAELLEGRGALTYRFELTNNGSEEVGEIGFLVDYRDQFGDTYYLISNNDGTIQNYSYTTKFNLKPGETLPLIGGTEAFRAGDVITEVRLAIYYYRYVDSGRKVYIPDSQLYWYSTKTGEMERPEKGTNYEQPDEDTLDLAERISSKLRANVCDLYSYVVKRFSRSRRPGKYIAAVGDGGWAKTWGLEAMDVIYGADDMLWTDDPFFLNRAFARVYQGETVTLKVVRNGEEIEIPISTAAPATVPQEKKTE